MTQTPTLPTFTDLTACVALALRAADEVAASEDPGSDESKRMADFVHSTAHVAADDSQSVTYRPWAAAAAYVGSEKYRLLKADDGVTFGHDPQLLIASLLERQRAEDVRLGLLLTPTVRRPFAGVVR